jgi:hypothetical protein
MGQQHAQAVAADQPGAAGEMAFQTLARERIDARPVQQGQEIRTFGCLSGQRSR